MSAIQQLITEHIDIWTAADTGKRSGRGRASSNAGNVYGVKKLRELILELAVRGRLVPQDSNDEPASELLKCIQVEKAKLVAEGKIKKDKPLAPIGDDEKPFELPHGWEWVRLGNIIDYVNGYAFSSKDFTTKGVGVVKIGDIQNGKVEPDFMSRVSVSSVTGLDSRLQVINGDLVIAMSGATTGKLGFNETKETFYLNQRVGKIVPFFVSKQFLYFDLTTKIADNLKKSFGSAIPNLSTEQINAIVTALPSTTEQHRIVDKVDELMALCDQLEAQHSNAAEAHEKLVSHLLGTLTQSQNADDFSANWQRIAAHFDTLFTTEASIDALKQTLLQLAVMGKLVPQDANEEPASELLKRIQAEKAKLVSEGKIKKDKPLEPITDEEKPLELPNGWEWVKCQDICIKITDGEHATPNRSQSGFYLLSARNITNDGIILDDVDYVPLEEFSRIRNRCDPNIGDILISCSGSIGRVALVDKDDAYSMVRSAAMIRPNQNWLFNKYIALLLRSTYLQNQMKSRSKQSAQANLFLGAISNLVFILPPLAEQHRIVTKVNELMTLCDQLINRITHASRKQQQLADVMIERVIHL